MLLKEKISKAALMCKLSYDDVAAWPDDTEVIKKFDTKLGMQAYVVACHATKTVFCVFRGSDQYVDWLFNVFAVPNTKGVHIGYKHVYSSIGASIEDCIAAALAKKKCSGYSVVSTGHSMGGALSQLLAYALIKRNIRCTVLTFGSFCVGRKRFQRKLSNNGVHCMHYRLTGDIVPRIMNAVFPNREGIVFEFPFVARNGDIAGAIADAHRMSTYLSVLEELLS